MSEENYLEENDDIEVDEIESDVNEEAEVADESKNDKFVRIAEGRISKLLSWIRKLDNLSNRNNYEYSDEEVEQMFGAIEAEIAEVKSHFMKQETTEKKFKFK